MSSVTAGQVWTSLAGFVLFYSALAIIDATLMVKFVRKGPDGLGLWPIVRRNASEQPSLQD